MVLEQVLRRPARPERASAVQRSQTDRSTMAQWIPDTGVLCDIAFIIPCFNEVGALAKTLAALSASLSFALSVYPALKARVILVDNNSKKEDVTSCYRQYSDHLQITLILRDRLPHTFALTKCT